MTDTLLRFSRSTAGTTHKLLTRSERSERNCEHDTGVTPAGYNIVVEKYNVKPYNRDGVTIYLSSITKRRSYVE